MGDGQHSYLLQQPPQTRRRPRGSAAELRGGRIVRKDRHSKVCTSRGPRDRRVRLSAHTAIQFYDVQDRLGYDRPSKAVDWLIQNAKRAIDEISHLPHPPPPDSSGDQLTIAELPFGIVPPSLETDAIADTIRLFFPVGPADGASSSDCPPQDLRLSLQSLQETSGSLADHTLCVWPEQNPVNWSGYVFQAQQAAVGDGPFTTQRCPLQSNGSVRGGWMEPAAFAYSLGEFPGFRVPARIRGEEEHDGSCAPLHLLVPGDHGNGKRDRQ